MKLNLEQYSIFEKFGWLEENYGTFFAMDCVIENIAFKEVVLDEVLNAFKTDDNTLSEVVEQYSCSEVLEFLDAEFGAKHAVNNAVIEMSLDSDESSSYSEICIERNKC